MISGALQLPDGTAGVPSLTFSADLDTGFSRRVGVGQEIVVLSIDGVEKLAVRDDGKLSLGGADFPTRISLPQTTNADGGISWGDTNLYRSAADTLKTDDKFIVGSNLTVSGDTTLTGKLLPSADNTYDIGSVTNRFRTIYAVDLRVGQTVRLGGSFIRFTEDPSNIFFNRNLRFTEDNSAKQILTLTETGVSQTTTTISSDLDNTSGLKFAKLTSGFTPTLTTDKFLTVDVDGNVILKKVEAGSAQAHEILSTTHSDTVTATVARGDLIVGRLEGATVKWKRLGLSLIHI